MRFYRRSGRAWGRAGSVYSDGRYIMSDTRIAKWGNSLAVRLPESILRASRLVEGDPVTLDVKENGTIVLRTGRRNYSLKELVSGITPKNRHRETDWGPAQGRESW